MLMYISVKMIGVVYVYVIIIYKYRVSAVIKVYNYFKLFISKSTVNI